jgi:hypothetical protein
MIGALAFATVIGVIVLWAFYGFRYTARPAGLLLEPSLAQYVQLLHGREARVVLFLARLHVLPEAWMYGLVDVRSMASGAPSYFFGKVYARGLWFYFPVLFFIKSTLGFLGLLIIAIGAVATSPLRYRREIRFLVIPPLFYLLISMASRLNIGARHILPLWVFGCVLAAAGAWSLMERDKRWSYVVALLVLAHIGSSALAHPNYIAYANEAWGGPTQTYRYLSDSNTDWGQQLKATKTYVDQHGIGSAGKGDCWIAYTAAPFILPEDYGIPCKRLPTTDSWYTHEQLAVPPVIHGTVFISASALNSFGYGAQELNAYQGFSNVKPIAYIQDGMFVFDGSFAVGQASALSHVQQTNILLEAGKKAEALTEAQAAVGLNPGGYREELAMGDALAAAGRKPEALVHYAKSLAVAKGMQGAAAKRYSPEVEVKIKLAQ